MNIKEKLAPRAAQSRQAFNGIALAIRSRALTIPRVMEDNSDEKLNLYLNRAIGTFAVATYKIKTNKTLDRGLQDRQLNKFGRINAIITFASAGDLDSDHSSRALDAIAGHVATFEGNKGPLGCRRNCREPWQQGRGGQGLTLRVTHHNQSPDSSEPRSL